MKMSLFNLPVERKAKTPESVHPWTRTIKEHYANKIKHAHNSVRYVCRDKKVITPSQKRVTFTVIGNRVTKEFIYCVNLVQGMHKYRWKNYDTPIIKGCTGVEWIDHFQQIKNKYGSLVCAMRGQVAVLSDNDWIGGENELKDLIESKYIYYLALNYQKESIKNFAHFLKSSRRPCAYMHISIDGEPIGSLIFMLYSDVVPTTCQNFLRLCKARRGGYSGTPIHRVVKDGWIQGGGFGLKNNNNMDCENFIVPHDRRGVLGMANAGRHIDCSTQFYVLLQPNYWLTAKHRFVAFGQLIDGEETLKKIEEVETYYEAPSANIVIYGAGILNLECHDIIINKSALTYLDGHIDDLVTVGEMFYEMLMERVFLEIKFEEITKMEQLGEGCEEKHSQIVCNEIKSTRRNDSDKDENNEIDVDFYDEYEPEISNTQMTPWPPSAPKETKPYFIALTDEPYPGEVDSNFDLKRLLQGDYCLESDLDQNFGKKDHDKLKHENRIRVISDLIDEQYRDIEDLEMDVSCEGPSIQPDELREIQDYLRIYGERVSFSGKIVKSVAEVLQTNPIEKKTNEKLSDEDIRMIRLALRDRKLKKKVILSARESMLSRSTLNMRRPTGYVRPEDVAKLLSSSAEEEEVELKDEIKADRLKRKVQYIQTQNAAYIRPEDLVEAVRDKIAKKVEEEEENTKKPTAYQSTVRISTETPTNNMSLDSGRPTNVAKKSYELVTKRLIDQITVEDDETVPTLKDYKPVAEIKNKANNSVVVRDSTALSLRQSMEKKTFNKVEETKAVSITENHPMVQARERAKNQKQIRPSLTISQYKQMNDDKRKEVKENKEKSIIEKKVQEEEDKLFKGSLRLPGDTPLYSPVSLSSDYLLELQKSLQNKTK